MLLTNEERQRFADYLEMDAESGEQLAAQMDKMKNPITDQLAKQHRIEAQAARIVARRLRAAQDMTIGRDHE